MISSTSILSANFLGHLGGNLDWYIVAFSHGLAGTILLRDFLASFFRHLLTRFHWFLKGFIGTFLNWLLLTFLYWLLYRDRLTALLRNLVAVFTRASIASMASIASVTSITPMSTGSTDQLVSGLTLVLIGCLQKIININNK